MAGYLPELTTEIVQLIADTLEPADLCSLRLVCREISNKTLHTFGQTCFANLGTNLTSESLQRLQNISEVDHLARHVHNLRIQCLGDRFNPRQSSEDQSVDLDEESIAEAELLENILVNRFVNCRSFEIESDYDIYPMDIYEEKSSDAVSIILAIGAGKHWFVKSLRVVGYQSPSYRSQDQAHSDSMQAKWRKRPQFEAAWSQLEELSLETDGSIDCLDEAEDLLSCASSLGKLSLSRCHGSAVLMSPLDHCKPLSKLGSLKFSIMDVAVNTIPDAFSRCGAALRTVTLQEVTLRGEDQWPRVFKNMKGKCPQLESFTAGVLRRKRYPTNLYTIVKFPRLKGYPLVPNSESSVSYNSRYYNSTDKRIVKTLEQPVQIYYGGKGKWISGISYEGPDMNDLFDILAETAI